MAIAMTKFAESEGRVWSARLPLPRSATISCLSVLIFFVLWQIAPELGLVNGRFTSQPTQVAVAAFEVFTTDEIISHCEIRRAGERHTATCHKRKSQDHPTIDYCCRY